MKTQYVLIDHENVQPKDLALLDGQSLKVIVFLGANQSKISAALATALQARGAEGRYVRSSGNGRNALDMHIAFYLGELAAREPDAAFHVISKDGDYDPLVAHLKARGIDVQRATTLAALLPPTDEKLDKLIAHLHGLKHARPRRTKTLASSIDALFRKELSEAEVQKLIAELERRGVISVQGAKVIYASL